MSRRSYTVTTKVKKAPKHAMSRKGPTIVWELYPAVKAAYIARKCKTEAAGFGILHETDENRVVDFRLVKADCSVATARIHAGEDGLDDALSEWRDKMFLDHKIAPARCLQMWVHTHPGDPTPSSTDWESFESHDTYPRQAMIIIGSDGDSWSCHVKYLLGGEYLCVPGELRFDVGNWTIPGKSPITGEVVKFTLTPAKLSSLVPDKVEAWDAEIAENVLEDYLGGGAYGAYGSHWSGVVVDDDDAWGVPVATTPYSKGLSAGQVEGAFLANLALGYGDAVVSDLRDVEVLALHDFTDHEEIKSLALSAGNFPEVKESIYDYCRGERAGILSGYWGQINKVAQVWMTYAGTPNGERAAIRRAITTQENADRREFELPYRSPAVTSPTTTTRGVA